MSKCISVFALCGLVVETVAVAVYVFLNPNHIDLGLMPELVIGFALVMAGAEGDRLRNRRGGRWAWLASLAGMTIAGLLLALIAFGYSFDSM